MSWKLRAVRGPVKEYGPSDVIIEAIPTIALPLPLTVPGWLVEHLRDYSDLTFLAKGTKANKVVLIKLVRHITGWGLKEAKDAIDAMQDAGLV